MTGFLLGRIHTFRGQAHTQVHLLSILIHSVIKRRLAYGGGGFFGRSPTWCLRLLDGSLLGYGCTLLVSCDEQIDVVEEGRLVENLRGLIQTHRSEPLQKYLFWILQSLVVNSRWRSMMNRWLLLLLLLDLLLLLLRLLLAFCLEIVGQFSLVDSTTTTRHSFSLILRICLIWLASPILLLSLTTTIVPTRSLLVCQLGVHLLSVLHLVTTVVALVGRLLHGDVVVCGVQIS